VSTREPGPGRSSDVIDAILGKVADNRTRTDTSNALFRAKALDQLDVAADIDNQLPLVSRRNWLLLVGAALIVVAFVVWAALTPATQTVSGSGRVLAPSGLLSVTAPASGFILDMGVGSGDPVQAGDTVAVLQGTSGTVPVTSVVAGRTWQVLGTIGSPVAQGEILVTVLPAASEETALIVLPPATAEQVRPGMKVNANGTEVGTVTIVEPPLPAREIVNRTGITVPAGELASIVEVRLNGLSEPGRSTTFTITLTSQTILEQIFRR
jgi:biotin carboxyl carrier protein